MLSWAEHENIYNREPEYRFIQIQQYDISFWEISTSSPENKIIRSICFNKSNVKQDIAKNLF